MTRRTSCHLARSLAIAAAFSACSLLPGSHRPERDISAFVSAALLPSNRVVFSFKNTAYRPAQGFAAFPDGGISKFTADDNILGVFDVGTSTLRILAREKNTRWTNDQGHFYIAAVNGALALVGRGGQTRDMIGTLNTNYLLNVDDGSMREVRYAEALARNGQVATATYLVSPAGHMVFVTASPTAQRGAEEGQIWLRSPDDSYRLVAGTHHYEGVENGEVIFWLLPTREFKAYNMTTHETRSLPGHKGRGYVDITEGVIVPMTGEQVSLGHKVNGTWSYAPLPITKDAVRKARVSH